MEKLLVTAGEARKILGVGEKLFRALGLPYRVVSKQKKYLVDDLVLFAKSLERLDPCHSSKEPKRTARMSGGTTSRSKEIGFAEARKQTIKSQPKQSSPKSTTRLYLATTTNESHA